MHIIKLMMSEFHFHSADALILWFQGAGIVHVSCCEKGLLYTFMVLIRKEFGDHNSSIINSNLSRGLIRQIIGNTCVGVQKY